MANKKNTSDKSKQHKIRWTIGFVFSCLVLIALASFLCYLLFYTFTNKHWVISLSAITMIAGAIAESIRLSKDWRDVGLKIIVALFLSLFAFLPYKKEHDYNFEQHFENSFYWFLAIFILVNIIIHSEKITPRLNEGTTFLQALAGVYWAVEIDLFDWNNKFLFAIASIMSVFCLYAAYHAFSNDYLNNRRRFRLSLISSIIMAVFAIDYSIKVLSQNEMRFSTNFADSLLTMVDHFFLGVASIYIAQNLMMLISFMPGEGFFENYKESRLEHINRYSTKQAKHSHSLLILIVGVGVFAVNYHWALIPYSSAIWLVLLFIPLLLQIIEMTTNQPRRYKRNY